MRSSDITLCPLYASHFICAQMFQMKIESVTDIPPTLVKLKVHRKQKTDNRATQAVDTEKSNFALLSNLLEKNSYLLVSPSLMCSTRASRRVLGSRLEEEEVPRGLVTTLDTTVWATLELILEQMFWKKML